MSKWIYEFGDGEAEGAADMRELLGGKGANLAEMSRLGLPVPPGFTITTEVCTHYTENADAYPKGLEKGVEAAAKKGSRSAVVLVDDTAYVADGASGLQIIDVGDPLEPTLLGGIDTTDAWDVEIRSTLVFLADGAAGLKIIDVSDPANAEILGSVDTTGIARGVSLNSQTPFVVIADGTAGLRIVDYSDIANPTLRGIVDTGDARDVVVRGDVAFVAGVTSSFTSVDISNPDGPAVLDTTPQSLGGKLVDVALNGDFAFGADFFFVNGVPILNVEDPADIVPRDILLFNQFGDDNGTGIALDDSYVYLTSDQGGIVENGASGNTRLLIGQYAKGPRLRGRTARSYHTVPSRRCGACSRFNR